MTTAIVSSYVGNNSIGAADLPNLIIATHAALSGAVEPQDAEPEVEKATAAQIRRSKSEDGLISFIDGKPYKSLKRHLSANDMTPEQYRERYGLPSDYPMVSPAYSARRSALAKAFGLGRKAPVKKAPAKRAAKK